MSQAFVCFYFVHFEADFLGWEIGGDIVLVPPPPPSLAMLMNADLDKK